MDFAKKVMQKYGWKEGDGLGKDNKGIAKPLKATLKFDTAGLGVDQAESDFNNHWWARAYNDAAQNVEIKQQKDGAININLKDKNNSVEITTKGYSLKKLKKAKESASGYGNFLQAATITKDGYQIENPDKVTVDDIAMTRHMTLPDEELFKACGGRTAHKGARHGLKLSGKLARLEKQEQELLAKMQGGIKKNTENLPTTVERPTETNLSDHEKCEKHVKIRKRKHKASSNDSIQEEALVLSCDSKEEIKHSKKKEKNRKKQDDIVVTTVEDFNQHILQKNKKKPKKAIEECVTDGTINQKVKKKKKKEKRI